ncbi:MULTISPECIES: hypothetical protein [Ramlibacter]|uniref:Uncharacterized protein n=1 Tax=Ramlibacter pinisoli TaxID=2682844 RepID=A0A6N8INR4_9BURK|nr:MULTISPECIES: hypothetical protein [Ramlibacter]MBA2960534.1 hypothetical protein [Ramlibacter sp. CGMCC 1.13660]MVQ27866.1 hypothetical protein [Ramlibacter pinisoli]
MKKLEWLGARLVPALVWPAPFDSAPKAPQATLRVPHYQVFLALATDSRVYGITEAGRKYAPASTQSLPAAQRAPAP